MVRQNIEETYLRNKITFDIIMEVDVAESVKTYVEMGIGVGILGSFTLGDKDKKRFTIHNVGHIFGKMEVGIYYREDKYISTAMRQFVKLFDPGLSNKLIL
jgi:DNA-binding transcriptional LysR family regulator